MGPAIEGAQAEMHAEAGITGARRPLALRSHSGKLVASIKNWRTWRTCDKPHVPQCLGYLTEGMARGYPAAGNARGAIWLLLMPVFRGGMILRPSAQFRGSFHPEAGALPCASQRCIKRLCAQRASCGGAGAGGVAR